MLAEHANCRNASVGFLSDQPDILVMARAFWCFVHALRGTTLQGRILSSGHNFHLLRDRNAALQRAGYQVVTTKESDLVLTLARQENFDAVLLCSSIPAHLRRTIALDLKRLRSVPPLIILCEAGESECFDDLAVEVVLMPRFGSHQPAIDAIARVIGPPQKDERKAL